MKPASILVVVPTTGGPLVLCALKPRPGLPTSAAFAAGDYRPLPWSGDYARLSAEGGPLSRLSGIATGPYELRLSGSFDAGRSWEAPVCLAHGLAALGYGLTAEPSEADLVVWATGAVDLDLAVLPGDYALLDKIERSRDLLAGAPQADLAVLLPDGPESAQAESALRALARARPPLVLPSGSVPAALDALARPARSPLPVRRRLSAPIALAVGLALAMALVALHGRWPTGQAEAPPTLADAAPAAVLVDELVAPADSSCRRVAFGADPPERRPIPTEAHGRLRASRLAPELCGLAFRPAASGIRVEVGPELRAAALPPTRLPDGAQAYFLRENARQNLVYTVQASPGDGAPVPENRLTHALVR